MATSIIERGVKMTNGQIPAGWYPDPSGDTTKIRYWSGSDWTDQFLDAATSNAEASVSPASFGTNAAQTPVVQIGDGQQGQYDAATQQGQPQSGDYAQQQQYGSASQPFAPTPSYSYQTPAPTTPQSNPRKGLAIAGLICALVGFGFLVVLPWIGFIFSLLGFIFGLVARKGALKGVAVAAIILGILGFILNLIYAIFLIMLVMYVWDQIVANPDLLNDPQWLADELYNFLGR
jgi:hypothetical protein